MSLISELRRRRVFRVAAFYGAAAWIITEVADTVGPALFLPDWTTRFVVIAIAAGFPIAMIMAWVFDIGPQGIERTPDTADSRKAVQATGQKLIAGITLAAATALLGVFLYQFISERGPRDSIAVLPFANMSGDINKDYFSDGISEELLNLLARIPSLKVAARTSSFAYRDKGMDARDVARELGVDTILEGSVRWAGDEDVRITAQLIDGDSGYHLWSETYNRRLSDIFKVQDEISVAIVQALKIKFEPEDDKDDQATVAREVPTIDPKAYDFYLLGRHEWKKRGEQAIRKSIEHYQSALGRAPGFARASAALAAAYVLLPIYDPENAEETIQAASDEAMKALAQNVKLSEAYAVLAQIDMDNWEWTDAEAGFFFATSLDSHDATAQHWYSVLLRNVGRLDESLVAAEKALKLDQESPAINANLASVHMLLGNDDAALESAGKAKELGYYAGMEGLQGVIQLRQGNLAEAETAFAAFAVQEGMDPEHMVAIVRARNDPELAELILTDMEAFDPGPEQFWTYVLLGRSELALAAAEALVENRSFAFEWLWSPEAKGLRQQPGFGELLRKAGLVNYWQQYGWPPSCQAQDDGISCT